MVFIGPDCAPCNVVVAITGLVVISTTCRFGSSLEDMTATQSAELSLRSQRVESSVIRDLLALTERPGVLSMAGGLPDGSTLDAPRMTQAATCALQVHGRYGPKALQYGETHGSVELRTVIAQRYACDVDSVVVTAGSQQGLDLVGRALLNDDDVAVVELPSYLGARQSLGSWTTNLHGIEADGDGLRTDLLRVELERGLRPKLVYVVTDFQNPTGATLSDPRRAELVELSDRYGFVIVADNPYGELRFRGAWPTPLRGANVVHLGSASKILAPGLRVGWMVASSELVAAVVRLKQAADLHTSTLTQLMVADVLNDAQWMTAHLKAIRALYQSRSQTLHQHLPGHWTTQAPSGGLFLWVTVPSRIDTSQHLAHAIEAGVAYVPGSAFGAAPNTMRLSYATLAPSDLIEAADRLCSVLR
jgi:2-aminoadipate transaminase